jgi:archaemetzincin
MKRYILLCILISISCSKIRNQTDDQKVIVIQPLGNFKLSQAKHVYNQILKINPNVVLKERIPFPKNSFYKPRNRYRADSIIKNLKNRIGEDSIIVGLSNMDISTTKGNFKDWGIMGLGYRPGKSCVVSDFRLNDENKNEQFYKVVLHELGHTEGLPHCPVKTCLMRDAEGKNHLDEENKFCESCQSHLIENGWQINKAFP